MNINTTISMGPGDDISSLPGTSTEIALQILTAAGGDPEKDTCNVTIMDSGVAGPQPELPPVGPPVEPPVEPPTTVINSTFATNNSPPPGDKQTRTNATSLASVTAVYVDDESTEGADISQQILGLGVGDSFEIRGVADDTRYGRFVLSAVAIDQDGFVEIPVSIVEDGSPLTNGACTLKFPVR